MRRKCSGKNIFFPYWHVVVALLHITKRPIGWGQRGAMAVSALRQL